MEIPTVAEAIVSKADEVLSNLDVIASQVEAIKTTAQATLQGNAGDGGFLMSLTVFILACIIGYYVVWSVTPALHSPLMAMTNAVSSVIVIGAILMLGSDSSTLTTDIFSFVAIVLASINIFGGLSVTQRMIRMFQKKTKTQLS